jgi:hypothetical protein
MKAFPILDYQNGQNAFIYEHKGMDLRDYFAAKAMQAYITNSHIYAAMAELSVEHNKELSSSISHFSYEIADAMMKERNVDPLA